jgi:hypothetical protein
VLEHRPLLSELLYDWTELKREESKAREAKVEITDSLYVEKDRQLQLSRIIYSYLLEVALRSQSCAGVEQRIRASLESWLIS